MQETMNPDVAAEHAARLRIAELWMVADRHPFYPSVDADVLELAKTGGYALSAKRLQGLFDENMLTGVAYRDGRRRWTATDIMTLFALLEVLRSYNPNNTLHRAKLSASELQYHEAKAEGREPFPDLDGHSLKSMLAYTMHAEDRNTRIGLWLALKAKLGLGDA